MPLPPAERWTRAREFAVEYRIGHPRTVKPVDPALKVTFKLPSDTEAAHARIEALQSAKAESNQRQGMSKIFTSKPKTSEYKPREISAALLSAIQATEPPGLVDALLEELKLRNSEDINIIRKSDKKWKKLKKIDQEDVRTGLLPAATRNGNLDTLRLLLQARPDQESLNESLQIALSASTSRNLDVIELLLAAGADAALHHNNFISAVSNSERDLVGLLLSAPKCVSASSMTEALYVAIERSDLEIAFILANTNADGDANSGKALIQAVQSGNPVLVRLMTLCKCPPSQHSLDEAVPMIFSDPTTNYDRKRQLLEALLSGGATGSRAGSTLFKVTKQCILQSAVLGDPLVAILSSLLHANASLDHKNSAALKVIVSSCRTDLMDIFFSSENFSDSLASICFPSIDPKAAPDLRVSIASKLLTKGAHGTPLHEALIHAVKIDHLEAVTLLLSNGFNKASVDYRHAAALQDAVSRERVQLVKLLLASRPTPTSASIAFPNIWHCQKDTRLVLAYELLKHGKASGDSVTKSLVTALEDCGPDRDHRLIKLLIQGGADLGYEDGRAFELATQYFDMPALDMLLAEKPQSKYLKAAFTSAMSLRPAENRFTACEKLLKSGANGDEVDKALTVAVSDESRDTSFLKIIIPNADINYIGGEALSLAVKRNLSEHALILLEQVPDITSFNNAFEAAMSLDESLNQLKFCRMLLEAPAPEQSASSALLKAVRSGRYDLCKLMLQFNASPDFNGGSCLITAVHDKNIKILVLLVESGNPKASKDSLDAAFKAALSITDRKAGLELVQILLDAGVGGQPLHTALIAQSKRGDQSLALCEILLKYGASINASQGEALNNAAKLDATLLLQNMLQGRKVEEACLIRAFMSSDHKRPEVVKIFLEAGLQGKPLHDALVVQSKRGDESLAVCNLLLKHGASVDTDDGEALNTAVTLGATQLAKTLLQERKLKPATLTRAFKSALKQTDRLRLVTMEMLFEAGLQKGSPIDAALLELVQSGSKDANSIRALLGFGASPHYKSHSALNSAASQCDHSVLHLLLQYVTDETAASIVFSNRLRDNWETETQHMIHTLEILLDHGAQGEDVQIALVLALSRYNTTPLAPHFVNILFKYEVTNVNYSQGRPLQIAAEIGDLDLLSRMVAKGATSDSLVMAFPHIFKVEPPADEATMLSLIKLFHENAGNQFCNSVICPKITDPPVFMSLDIYPKSSRILEAILDMGFPVDQKMYHDLPSFGNVDITPLYWALSEHERIVTEPVIYLLLKRDASVEGHPSPLLHLAIKKGYSSIVHFLIEAGADVDAANLENMTPLSLAYQSGDIATMKALLEANAEPDDGTLHEAARNLDLKAIEALLEHDHDPNRPSPEHEGRSALAELCLRAPEFATRSSDKNLERDAKKAIKALIKGGARTNIQTKTADDCEKSLLLLALDSKNPLVMAKAFLDSNGWKYVNEDFNLYTNGEYTFSPAMYVERGVWDGVPGQVRSVLDLLKSYQVKRRFWKNEGEQPPDMVDAPPEIKAAEDARKAIIAERLRKETERQEQLAAEEAELQAEYERRHKKAEIERKLKLEDQEAELAARAKMQEQDLKYKESLVEIEEKKGDVELKRQEGLAAIEVRRKKDMAQEDIRVLEEERRNIAARSNEGYLAAELYNRMQQAGIAGSRLALADVSNRGNRALEWNG